MYAHVKEREKNPNKGNAETGLLHPLLKEFQATKTFLRYLTCETTFEDDTMEELAYLASGVDLKESVKDMISAYLKYVQKDVLVISLDDIDLNTAQAFTMVEQIRKYLILPNVVIFLAIKLNQLSEVIRLELSKQFQSLLTTKQMSFTEVVEMAERYLLKLIPLQSRVYLPVPETFFHRALEIYKTDRPKPDKFESIKRAVPELIFKKCRYLFYNTRGTTSLIVPRNLRELRLLISLLYNMPDYQKNTNKTEGNKQLFKRYFFGSWLDTLGKESRDVAYAILAENEPTLFNKTVIRQLVGLYFKDKEEQIPENYHDVIDIQNLAFNVSLGDCFYFMDYIGNINLDTETKKLLFFIKSVYSIRLYEYYDELTDRLRNQTTTGNAENKPDNKVEQPYRAEILEDISLYEKLIGGSFYLLEGDNLIGPQRIYGTLLDRELRLINGKKLFELIKDVKEHKNMICISQPSQETIEHEGTSSTAKEEDANNKTSQEISEEASVYMGKLRLVEFFMLTVSRYVWTTDATLNESGIHKYRLNAPAYYDREINNTTRNLCFNILTPLFTLLDIQHAYRRFDEEIYAIAMACRDSFAYKFLNLVGEEKRETLLSKVGLRNAEIIEDIFTYLKLNRRQLKLSPGARNVDIVKDFYKFISNYHIASYDYEDADADTLYHIELDYFKHFETFLGEADKDLFESIFATPLEKGVTSDTVEKEFQEFLAKYRTMQQVTILANLKQYNRDFVAEIGLEKIKQKFPAGKSFNTDQLKSKLEELCNENGYVLDDGGIPEVDTEASSGSSLEKAPSSEDPAAGSVETNASATESSPSTRMSLAGFQEKGSQDSETSAPGPVKEK